MYPYLLKSHIKQHPAHNKKGSAWFVREHEKTEHKITKTKEGYKVINVEGKSKIDKGIKVLSAYPTLKSYDLFPPDVQINEALAAGKRYYIDELMKERIVSPAFASRHVQFTPKGWLYISNKEFYNKQHPERQLTDDGIKRRIKLLPKVKEIIKGTPYIDEVREEAKGTKRYGLLGKFEDGSVIRVIVEETKKGGKNFLSVFDWEDVSKKIKQTSLPGLHHDDPTSSGVGKEPSHRVKSDIKLSSSGKDVKLKKSITLGLYLLRKSRPLHGRLDFNGLKISIENRKGSIRQWHDPHEDREGMTRMSIPYGYIRLTHGMDGDHVGCYVGPHRDAPYVFIVHQMKAPDFKEYDEDKVMLGFLSEDEAKQTYLDHYDDPRFLGSITRMLFEEFKETVLGTKDNPQKLQGSDKRHYHNARDEKGNYAKHGSLGHMVRRMQLK